MTGVTVDSYNNETSVITVNKKVSTKRSRNEKKVRSSWGLNLQLLFLEFAIDHNSSLRDVVIPL